MIAIPLEAILIRPETRVINLRPESNSNSASSNSKTYLLRTEPPSLEDYHAFYLPETGEMISDKTAGHCLTDDAYDSGDVEELKIIKGITTVPIFAVVLLEDQAELSHGGKTCKSWATDWIGEGDWDNLTESLQQIYKDIDAATNNALSQFLKKELNPNFETYPVSTLTLWRAITSRDWESGHTELEALLYTGLGIYAPRQKPEEIRLDPS